MRHARSLIAAAALACALPLPALAHDDDHHHGHGGRHDVHERLSGYQEVPAVSSAARATFRAEVDAGSQVISWRLSYAELEGNVEQAHIHFGQRGVNGGIVVFLCTNRGNGPAGTPLCPGPRTGMLTGSITPVQVSPDPAGATAIQGIGPGEFDELVRALRNEALYVNLHSTRWPGGELRAQLTKD